MNKQILRLAIPNIISNISVPLLGLVDLAVVGHLASAGSYIGAIALGNTIFNFIYWGFAFLRMGTSGMTAQAYGRNDTTEMASLLTKSLMAGVLGSLLIIALQHPIALASFWMIDGSPEVENLAAQYYHIRIWAAPASLGLFALSGWFIGMQNSVIPMVITIATNILNLGFNLWFVWGLGMKSDGVAWGTLLAQYIGLLMGIVAVGIYYRHIFAGIKTSTLLRLAGLKRFFIVNTDIFIRMICVIFVFTFFNFRSAKPDDDTILAVNTMLLNFFMLFSFFADGFAYAAESLVGKYTGAGNHEKLKRTVRYIFGWGLSIGGLMSVVYATSGNFIIQILTNDSSVIAAAQPYMIWIALVPFLSFASFIWDGVYIGATATALMRNTMIFSAFGVFLPVYLLSYRSLDNHALWLALLSFMISRGILQTIFSRKVLAVRQ